MEIIRGTTPTIQFTFKQIDPSELYKAFLVIKQGYTVIEKTIEAATISEGIVSFVLTQKDTLALKCGVKGCITLDWLTNSGTRGRSAECTFTVGNSGKDKVIV